MHTADRKPYPNIFCLACRALELDLDYSDMKCHSIKEVFLHTCFSLRLKQFKARNAYIYIKIV